MERVTAVPGPHVVPVVPDGSRAATQPRIASGQLSASSPQRVHVHMRLSAAGIPQRMNVPNHAEAVVL